MMGAEVQWLHSGKDKNKKKQKKNMFRSTQTTACPWTVVVLLLSVVRRQIWKLHCMLFQRSWTSNRFGNLIWRIWYYSTQNSRLNTYLCFGWPLMYNRNKKQQRKPQMQKTRFPFSCILTDSCTSHSLFAHLVPPEKISTACKCIKHLSVNVHFQIGHTPCRAD